MKFSTFCIFTIFVVALLVAPSVSHGHHDHQHLHKYRNTYAKKCYAVGIWSGQYEKDYWCQANCFHIPPNCPYDKCQCTSW